MNSNVSRYHRHRFPPEIISHAVWLYHRFSLGFRDIEDLLAERGVIVSYETVRQWCMKFGHEYAWNLRRGQRRKGDIWHLDEVFVTIRGERHYLWRAVDQDGDVIDILVQRYRNAHTAKRFLRKLLKGQRNKPLRLLTDKLRSYSVAHRDVLPSVTHDTSQYANNRAEVSHQPTRQRERLMRRWSCARLRRCSLCYATNQLDKRSSSWRFTVWCRASSGWDVIYCEQRITGCYATGRSGNGVRPRLREKCPHLQVERHAGAVKLTEPFRRLATDDLSEEGASAEEIQAAGSWRSIQTPMDIYKDGVKDQHRKSAAEKLSKHHAQRFGNSRNPQHVGGLSTEMCTVLTQALKDKSLSDAEVAEVLALMNGPGGN